MKARLGLQRQRNPNLGVHTLGACQRLKPTTQSYSFTHTLQAAQTTGAVVVQLQVVAPYGATCMQHQML